MPSTKQRRVLVLAAAFSILILMHLGFKRSSPSGSSPASSQRYLLHDWSLYLGWNNLRYQLEAGALQAQLLGRALVVPSFVYLRSCEVERATCSMFLQQVDREVETGRLNEWANAEEAVGWRIDIHEMINLTTLSHSFDIPVLTTADWVAAHDLPSTVDRSDGHTVFTDDPRTAAALREKFSVHVIADGEYDTHPHAYTGSSPIYRFDTVRPSSTAVKHFSAEEEALRSRLKDARRMPENYVELFRAEEILGVRGEAAVGRELEQLGWMLAYTFESSDMWEFTKSVTKPETQAMERATARGWVDDYGLVDADILVLPGEVHDGRKAGFMRFTTAAARDIYSEAVIFGTSPRNEVIEVGQALADEMTRWTAGRQWLGLHMRRGDFVSSVDWSPSDFGQHLEALKKQLATGRQVLVDLGVSSAVIPREDDPFFIATDESDFANLAQLRAAGAVLASDLLTPAHRQKLGPSALFGDFQSQVEQAALARAGFFGSGTHSSVPGWVLSQRAALGHPPETGVQFP